MTLRSDEIQPGDVLRDLEGGVAYEVMDVDYRPPHIVAVVKFADGGTGVRFWERGKETPLVRPNG